MGDIWGRESSLCDGKRVKSEINGETILFVGAHYEAKSPGAGQQVTKYYFAGSARIAHRRYTIPQSMAVEYFLGDHLGSTSMTTDANGAKVSEMRYTPWGEIRYSWKDESLITTPAYSMTQYTFTGQYSYVDDPTTPAVEDFGLMYFKARWYDSSAGRFAQADAIVPEEGNSQAWDRYAYALNNSVRYSDPSGHSPCDGRSDYQCRIHFQKLSMRNLIGYIEKTYHIEIEGPWTLGGLGNFKSALDSLASEIGGADQLNYWLDLASGGKVIPARFLPSDDKDIKPACGGHACWKHPGDDSFNFDAYSMSSAYLNNYFPRRDSIRRPEILGLRELNASIRTTMIHEITHALIQAHPKALTNYKSHLGPDASVVFDPKLKSPSESMATSLAIYVSSGGMDYPGYLDQTSIAGYILHNFYAPQEYGR